MCSCHSILECCVTFSGVKLSMRSFVLYYIDLSFSHFLLISISILYGLVFKPFLGRVTISLFISILYGLKSFLGRVAVFISICIYYSHIILSPFGCNSLSSNDSNGISRTILLLLTYGVCHIL